MPSKRRVPIPLIGLLLCVSVMARADQAAGFDAAEYDQATRMILCDCGCHPQSVHDCACGRAAGMRVEIHGLVSQGMSGDEVIAHYVKRVGDQIRIVPTATGFNLIAWLGPLIGLVAGSVLMIFLIRRWSRATDAGLPETQALPPSAAASDDAYQQRLRDALESLE